MYIQRNNNIDNDNDKRMKKTGSSSLELGEAEIRILKFTISMSTPVTILPLHPTGLVTVPEGSTLKVFCQADGTPLPTLTWHRNFQLINSHIMSRQRINISSDRIGTSTLRFLQIKHEDSASYSCQAANKNGQVQKAVRIRVTKTTTVATTTPSLCEQYPDYCRHGRCVTGIGTRHGVMCLCAKHYEGNRCEKFVTPKNQLKVKSTDDQYTDTNKCIGGNCFSWTSNYLFFYIAFGFLIFILALLLLVFLLQRKRRNQLQLLSGFSKMADNKDTSLIDPQHLEPSNPLYPLPNYPHNFSHPSSISSTLLPSDTLPSSSNFSSILGSNTTRSFCRDCTNINSQLFPNYNEYTNTAASCTHQQQTTYTFPINTETSQSINSASHSRSSVLMHPCIYNPPTTHLIPLYTLNNTSSHNSPPTSSQHTPTVSTPCTISSAPTHDNFPIHVLQSRFC